MAGTDDYLHEAALADNPPSGTFYDPDHATNTTRLPSLGTHEHWNNAADKQYSRNLGTGDGIELFEADVHQLADFDDDRDVDQEDFARLQLCLGSDLVQPELECDLADLNADGFVDSYDVNVFHQCMTRPNETADPNCGG
jgi:hypothetical protein